MNSEIELIADGDGLAVIGDRTAVERFLSSAGVPSRDLALHQRLSSTLSTGAGIAQASSEVAANAGRWVKLTEESAKAMNVGTLMKGSSSGVSRAVLTDKGKIKGILEIVKTPRSMLANPAMLAGASGHHGASSRCRQTMEEITDYLAAIDEKVDDILRAQKDAALADMIGVGFVIDEAMTVRDEVGRVSDVTWSKVSGAPQTIARTQAYALRQLDALAEKLEKKNGVSDLAKVSKIAEETVQEWLAVLARCFQLQDGIAVLELDRVLDSSPEDLDRHRAGLQTARQKRRELIARSTVRLLARMDAAAATANAKVLLHPLLSGEVVHSSNQVGGHVIEFNQRLGIEQGRQSVEAKRWTEAASDTKEAIMLTTAAGVTATGRFGTEALMNAKSVASSASAGIAERFSRRRGEQPSDDHAS
ncbi:hypothetical protein [Microbacterium elymi]|uniref:DUF222 domain-containing protein n=1 Tax=Microbacterium elymi TaxID=2909587 RepID=A0ABY5NMK3_9MICO|nr:hypothetical protein [Microbacterium elymi]UUT36417.1 hypothetical protein L2X98_26195 [Microbacterium elymi]